MNLYWLYTRVVSAAFRKRRRMKIGECRHQIRMICHQDGCKEAKDRVRRIEQYSISYGFSISEITGGTGFKGGIEELWVEAAASEKRYEAKMKSVAAGFRAMKSFATTKTAIQPNK